MLKATRYRIYPTEAQKEKLNNLFGGARWAYNAFLHAKEEQYFNKVNGLDYKTVTGFSFITDITNRKYSEESLQWLTKVNAQVLQQAILNADKAYRSFFLGITQKPRFKSKKNPTQSISFPQSGKIGVKSITIPGVGKVKASIHRTFESQKGVTVTKESTGKYYASVLWNTKEPDPVSREILSKESILGIDVGIKTFAVTSEGESLPIVKEYKQAERKIGILQRSLSKKKKGSANRAKVKTKLALAYEKVRNRRKDNLHKLSRSLVNSHEAFAVEDLNIEGMMKNHKLAKAIGDSSWRMFTSFLTYKSAWEGKQVLQIGRFEASSKTCSICGSVKDTLGLSERAWTCSTCGTSHDRDVNAAVNIRNFAWKSYKESQAEKPTLGTGEGISAKAGIKSLRRVPSRSKSQEATGL